MVRAVSLALVLAAFVPAGELTAQTLRGSRVAMQRQNSVARNQDFTFLQTSAQVRRFANSGLLVRVSGNRHYRLAGVSHPYARPAVRTFLERLGEQYSSACGERLVVTSLTRPVREQPRNASDLSVHPAGMAVDLRISRKASCRRWLERTLISLESRRVIDATKERRPAHYHVAVFPAAYESYVRRLEGDRPPVKLASTGSRARSTVNLPPEPDPVEIRDPVASGEAMVLADAGADASMEDVPDEVDEATLSLAEESGSDVGEYRVNRGDTLWTIARRHGTTVEQLKELNRLRTSRIAAGQVLSVPLGTSAR
jgi:nucleoid-associated protein YgaU